ncbi:peptidoglycan-binding protein [Leptolyngbya sp. AN02str]|uniref:peptidoglycan-binding domain-containing protein n=1 Tax=Leptolyngbya sp. AN02str TaxID=3423363 RepID=UPI003D3187BC
MRLHFNLCVLNSWMWVAIAGTIFVGTTSAAIAVEPTRNSDPAYTIKAAMLLSQALGNPTVQLEDSGEAVTELQTRLTDLGYYSGPITGYFGSLTESAVILFQQSIGLSADGIAGEATWAALRQSGGAEGDRAYLQLGDVGDQVASVQASLKNLGYYSGVVDGVFGEQTAAAVINFQTAQGISPDGLVGPNTLSALNRPAPPVAPSSASGFPAPNSAPGVVSPVVTQPSTTPSYPGGLPQYPTGAVPAVGFGGQYSVAELQQRLSNQGFYRGPIDGVMSPATEQAIRDAQRAYGL